MTQADIDHLKRWASRRVSRAKAKYKEWHTGEALAEFYTSNEFCKALIRKLNRMGKK